MVHIVSNTSAVHILTSYPSKINFNIILPSTPRSPQWPLPLSIHFTFVLALSLI